MTDVERDVELLAKIVAEQFGHVVEIEGDEYPNAVLNVLDCVLSLNRSYDRFAYPRVRDFATKNPDITQLSQFLDLMRSYPSPTQFGISELRYNHGERMSTLAGVTRYLIVEQQLYEGNTEIERLRKWALTVRPTELEFVGVRGFGLAGFQYLRMLFGAQTTKPDVHIIRFVSESIERKVDENEALLLLELVAKQMSLPLREVDGAIWISRARQ